MNALRTLALCLAATSLTALAQKPAIVKDTEANGRMPYVHTVESSCPLNDPGSCGAHTNIFPAVPVGYRLVVTHVSVRFPTNTSGSLDLSVLLTNGQTVSDTGYAAMNLQPPVCTGPATGKNFCVSSAPVSFYVEQALTPTIVVRTGSSGAYVDDNIMRVTIVGYLLSL